MIPSVLGNDLPNGGYYRWFDEWADQHDTPQNRAVLVRNLVDNTSSTLRSVPGPALAVLTRLLAGWVEQQSGDVVLGWLADEGIAPGYERFVEDRP